MNKVGKTKRMKNEDRELAGRWKFSGVFLEVQKMNDYTEVLLGVFFLFFFFLIIPLGIACAVNYKQALMLVYFAIIAYLTVLFVLQLK